ncbi:MarR family winged helix-turn-helix transcriptional regulator [Salinimicrobium sediminilitoris]|uniref:MarR family winged helix-turn-helix transcriptional regulator n=1 Tax=Salinimicrobium sediminilitoris TaxID=2876715 RepID=UPI001E3BDE31|nr:MarR family transcriptional regulator [Salinimicrobium sediminilitoris]MCC8360187.1 MarR family transcriptional regulator [Salinimicrobium sediminilitoris]
MKKEEQLKLENQICFPIYSVSRLITRAYKPHLDKLGLTYPQYLVLLVLWEENGLSVNKIGRKLLLNTNTLSPLIKRMEKNELLTRTRSKDDERTVLVDLTEKGINLKEKAASIPQELLNTLLNEDVEPSDVILLKKTLDSWINILAEDPESPADK